MTPDIESEAADWLAKLDAEPESPDVQARVEDWVRADPAHEAAYLRLKNVWGRLDRLASLRPAAGEPVDANLLARDKPAFTVVHPWRFASAAVILLAIATAGLVTVVHDQAPSYVTQVGERRHIQLEDSSVLSLNTQSNATVEYEPNRRQIELKDGEALFKVAKDPNRPFVVTAKGIQIRAVGTEFSVRTRPGSVEVIVTEGVVDVTSVRTQGEGDDSQTLGTLSAGQIGVYGKGIQTVHNVSVAEAGRRIAWDNGMIAFDGQTLSEALTEFNRYNIRKLAIADPAIGSLRVGGYFHTDDVSSFISALGASFGIRTSIEDGNTIYLVGPAKG